MSKVFRIFNGEVKNKATKAFMGEASGIRDYDDIPYPVMLDLNKGLFGEYWIEDEIKLGGDMKQYATLTDAEKRAYKLQTSALNWLDSLATDFNYLLGFIVTDPATRSVIALINSFEVLHNRSYQYLTSSVLNDIEKKEVFEEIKNIDVIVERNMHIIKPIEDAVNIMRKYIGGEFVADEHKVTKEEVMQAIFMATTHYQILEGIYFSGGFVYFHSLARAGKMQGSNDMINLIKEDENQHNVFYGTVIQIMVKEYPHLNTEDNWNTVINAYKKAVQLEKEWARYVLEGVDTIGIKEYDNYVEYLANVVARNSGLEDIFPENSELKSNWINTHGSKHKPQNEDAMATREDFLQANTIAYGHDSGEDFDL